MSTEVKPPEMPASWQRFIRRDLPLAVAIGAIIFAGMALSWYKDAMKLVYEQQEKRIADSREQNAQYSRVVVGLAERGYSASDLADAGSKYFYNPADSTNEKSGPK